MSTPSYIYIYIYMHALEDDRAMYYDVNVSFGKYVFSQQFIKWFISQFLDLS